jgi:hypothetical protein
MQLEQDIRSKAAGLETAPYQIPVLLYLLNLVGLTSDSIQGARVCEIGGDHKFGIARLWHSLTGHPVVVSSPSPYTELSDADLAGMGVQLYRTPFEDTPLPPASFDIIYGCGVLEHIAKMQDFSRHVFEMLAPGGWAILQGCPLWESQLGHHAYLQCDGINYFMGQSDCPVPDYGHLYMTEQEMHIFLIQEKDLPPSHADALCHQIYQSDHINRMTIETICTAFFTVPWQEFLFKSELDYQARQVRNFLADKGINIKDVQRPLLYLAVKKLSHI